MRSVYALLLFPLILAGALRAQATYADIEKAMPPIEIEMVVDDKGLQQFNFASGNCPGCKGSGIAECRHCATIENAEVCPECDLKKKAPCHLCAGKGSFANPIELAICPGCAGHGLFICYLCGNKGKMFLTGGNPKGAKCPNCKGSAGLPCTVCKGQRLVPSLYGGKVEKAKLKKLQKTREALDKLIAALDKWTAKGKPRDDRKAFNAMLKPLSRDLPALKTLPKQSDEINKKLEQPYQDIERVQIYAYDRVKTYLMFYLVHQSRTLDACIARAEFNEKAAKKRD